MPERTLLGVVRTCWVSRGRADAAIFLLNKVFVAQVFSATIAPFTADAFVQALSESFGQAIRESFGHDRVVIVVFGSIRLAQLLQPDPAGDGECADMIAQSRLRSEEHTSELQV